MADGKCGRAFALRGCGKYEEGHQAGQRAQQTAAQMAIDLVPKPPSLSSQHFPCEPGHIKAGWCWLQLMIVATISAKLS